MADKSDLKKANGSASRLGDLIDSTLRRIDGGVRDAKSEIQTTVTRRVRHMLLENFSRSGVKSRSGKLENALANATVRVNLGGRHPKIVISMPAGVSGYSKKKGGGNFYHASASVNYGAVRGQKGSNKKQRKADKRSAYKAAKKKTKDLFRIDSELYGKTIADRSKKDSDRRSVSTIGGGTATRPFSFWELTDAQKKELSDMVSAILSKVVFS